MGIHYQRTKQAQYLRAKVLEYGRNMKGMKQFASMVKCNMLLGMVEGEELRRCTEEREETGES